MKIGDLVVARFDDDMVLGIITGRCRGGHTFIYARGKGLCGSRSDINTNDLPRSRLVKVQLRDEVFTNLCDVDWSSIEGQTSVDCTKLQKWTDKCWKEWRRRQIKECPPTHQGK